MYPVKSFAGSDVDAAQVNPWGLEHDRRWGLVDSAGDKITAREHNQLLGLTARTLGETVLQVSDRDEGVITVDMREGGETIAVNHGGQGTAVAARDDVSRWLSERLGLAVRLVWQPDPTVRSIASEDGGEAGDVVSLADAAPLLLVAVSSLRQLDDWTEQQTEALDVVRFRPNVVIDGAEPFVEESWSGVTIGTVCFRVTMICDRCVMTTIEPSTLVRGKEPIRTLAVHRRRDNKTWFGIRLTPLGPGRIHVGDQVEALGAK
ncbi:Flavodoxin reductases (ferredoxin-NADPH reductases) family 1 [Leifsonia rubra CMS 76R]|nr:Flavodoxin reductases (ferredoxin-NADPH reductases) family 1 [Leifsonia rubra CMS 76R]